MIAKVNIDAELAEDLFLVHFEQAPDPAGVWERM